MRIFFKTFLVLTLISTHALATDRKKASSVYALISTSLGNIEIKLFHDKAPKTVNNFIGLAVGHKEFVDVEIRKKVKRPFYNGLTFHRVVPNFIVQAGDPLGNGTGTPGYTIDQEIHPDLYHDRPGVVAMAAAKPGKNGSQFYITLKDLPELDKNFTIFGQVTSGFPVLKAMANVKRDLSDRPITPIKINSVKIIYR